MNIIYPNDSCDELMDYEVFNRVYDLETFLYTPLEQLIKECVVK